eukprot:1285412-Amphidinium_carterae.1
MEVDFAPTQVDLTANAETSMPPTPRNPTGSGSYLESTTLTITKLVNQTEQQNRETGNETTPSSREEA